MSSNIVQSSEEKSLFSLKRENVVYGFTDSGLNKSDGAFAKLLIDSFSILLPSTDDTHPFCNLRELTFLKTYLNTGKTVFDYFYQPLYAFQSQEWLQGGQEFVKVLREYGHGFDLWADWFQGRIDGVPTDKRFLEAVAYLPEEIFAQEPKYINAYLKSLGNAAGALNRVRVIFLGYGEAGKTSLIRALNGLEVNPGKEKMTPGIDSIC